MTANLAHHKPGCGRVGTTFLEILGEVDAPSVDRCTPPRDEQSTAVLPCLTTTIASQPLADHSRAFERARLPTSVGGRYVVVAEIGRGAMGIVQRAYDHRLQREVALKHVRLDVLDSESEDRARREALAMAMLSHPNVVAVYDIERVGHDLVIAMEYVRGRSLAEWLGEPRSWREIVRVFVAAGRGLAAAHARGLLHRDFKPANVLIGDDGRARVGDFGLACLQAGAAPSPVLPAAMRGAADAHGRSDGTPRYMAPEQHEARELGPATDQYSFCVALWGALTEQPPFSSSPDISLLESKRRGPPPWPRTSRVPTAIVEALRRGLSFEVGDRWPDMNALLERLEHDPRHRRWIVATSVPVVLGASTLAWGAHHQALAERCTGAEAQLSGAWDESRQAEVEHAFAASSLVYAAEVWQRVDASLDRYTQTWIATHLEACEATTVRAEQPSTVMDLKMACLGRARVSLAAVTGLLATADAQVVENAYEVIAELPDLERCGDAAALRAEVPPPPSSEVHAVEAIRVDLAEVAALRAAGKYPETLARMRALAKRRDAIQYPPLHTEIDLELALAWRHAERSAEAEAAYKSALRTALANKQWQLALSAARELVHELAWSQARVPEGLALAETAKGLLHLVDDGTDALLLTYVASAYESLGQFVEAEALQRQALELAQARGSKGLALASLRTNLGLNLRYQGRHTEAERELRAAIALAETILPPDHPDLASDRWDLANLFYLQGRLPEAEREHRKVLASWEKALGPEHPDVAMARGTLANVLATQGRLSEAEENYRTALEVQRKSIGVDHRLTLITQHSLGAIVAELGRYDEGEALLRDALAKEERIYGSEHHDVASTRILLASVLVRHGHHDEAAALARRALASLRRSSGHDPIKNALGGNALGGALVGLARYVEAEQELRTALDIAIEAVGAAHHYVGRIRSNLGAALQGRGRLTEAEQELRAALALQLEVFGPDHANVASTRGRLGHVLRAQRLAQEAEAEYRAALAATDRNGQQAHPSRAELEWGLGSTLIQRGALDEALAVLERSWVAWGDDERIEAHIRAELATALAGAVRSHDPARSRHLVATARRLRRR